MHRCLDTHRKLRVREVVLHRQMMSFTHVSLLFSEKREESDNGYHINLRQTLFSYLYIHRSNVTQKKKTYTHDCVGRFFQFHMDSFATIVVIYVLAFNLCSNIAVVQRHLLAYLKDGMLWDKPLFLSHSMKYRFSFSNFLNYY